jgi:hypothetical protein
MRVTTQDEARQVLLDEQMETVGMRTIPASGATIETDAGWAFFNVNGYLGTVTEEGEVISELDLVKSE